MSTETLKPDWEAIERLYRAGQFTVSEIARQHGISHTAINKRAKKEGWPRDLTERVRQEVSARLVSKEVSVETSREIVTAAAERGVSVVEGHLRRAERLKRLADLLITELETYMAGGKPSVEIFVARADSPSTVLRTVADTAERVQKLERQSLNLDATRHDTTTVNVSATASVVAEPLDPEAIAKASTRDSLPGFAVLAKLTGNVST